jgi:hypothetical protein
MDPAAGAGRRGECPARGGRSEYRNEVVARLFIWRLLGAVSGVLGVLAATWLLGGGIGKALRGAGTVRRAVASGAAGPAGTAPRVVASGAARAAGRAANSAATRLSGGAHPAAAFPWVRASEGVCAAAILCAALLAGMRRRARAKRRYVRMEVLPYRTDRTTVEGITSMYEALHKRVQRRWWRRLAGGQPSVALEVHYRRGPGGAPGAGLVVGCPEEMAGMVGATVRSAYPNSRVGAPAEGYRWTPPPRFALVRLKKHGHFIKRVKQLDRYELAREPPMDRLMNVMAACGGEATVQLALTPTPALFERYAKHRYKRREDRLSRARREHLFTRDRSLVEEAELKGGLDVQHRPLFFADLRIVGPSREVCERIASELRAEGAENRLVERGTAVRHGLFGTYRRRVARGEGNPWAGTRKGVYASTELAALWHMPSVDYATVPFARAPLPPAPAAPAIMRAPEGEGSMRDEIGPVTIHPEMRRQNTAVPGAVDQGKSSYLAATVAEDLRRERCAVIVLDPKGDAAEATVSLVGEDRVCTLLDFAHPTCGFNPLAVEAPADVIADYVVGALKNLFTDDNVIMRLCHQPLSGSTPTSAYRRSPAEAAQASSRPRSSVSRSNGGRAPTGTR